MDDSKPLEGFVGMLNFAKEVYNTVMSPVWRFLPRPQPQGEAAAAGGKKQAEG